MKYETEGARLKELRIAADVTLDYAGEYIGLSGPAIGHYEKGRNRPSIDGARALDDLYKAAGEVVALYGFTPRSGGPSLADVDRKMTELLAIVVGMGATQKQLAADVRRALDLEADEPRQDDPTSLPSLPAPAPSTDPTGPLPHRP
jgi:transcriptional regulator with XRE-family HTH domain